MERRFFFLKGCLGNVTKLWGRVLPSDEFGFMMAALYIRRAFHLQKVPRRLCFAYKHVNAQSFGVGSSIESDRYSVSQMNRKLV